MMTKTQTQEKWHALRVKRPVWLLWTQLAERAGMGINEFLELVGLSLAKQAQERKTE